MPVSRYSGNGFPSEWAFWRAAQGARVDLHANKSRSIQFTNHSSAFRHIPL